MYQEIYQKSIDINNVYDIENLISWLKERDSNERYNYNSCKMCLLAQYFRAHIPEFVSVGIDWWDNKGNRNPVPRVLNDIAYGNGEDWTFGAALERAERCI